VSREPSVEFQLGALNVNWDRVVRMKSDLFDRAALMHCMGAEVKVNIVSDTAKETGYRLCYNAGIDGSDARYWVEPVPHHHVDWDMSEAEWEELRATIWWSGGPYAKKLREAGKLGSLAPGPRPMVGGGGGGVITGNSGDGGNWVRAGGFPPGTFTGTITGRTPRPPSPQPLSRLRPNRYGPPMPVRHEKQYPVDGQEDTWRCDGCGMIYKVAVGFAICPNDPSPPTGSKVGGGDPIA
jgi:hypothetical protein